MIPIPDIFTKYDYTFRLLKRTAKAAIYEQLWDGKKLHAYEVHRIRRRQDRLIDGKQYPACERLASDNDWGTRAKTYTVSIVGPGSAKTSAEAQLLRWSGSPPVKT